MIEKVIIKNLQNPKILNKLFSNWIEIINSFTQSDISDALYVYNERATLSTLAGAAWKSGFTALEEFVSVKYSSKRDLNQGRVDLWMKIKEVEYTIEAKQVWVRISPRSYKTVNIIENKLKEARHDVVRSKDYSDLGFGIVFIIPMIAKSFEKSSTLLIEKFLSKLHKIDFDILAYTFPENAKVYILDEKYLCPGVVLIGRVPKRNNVK